jgi:hypothetical protein
MGFTARQIDELTPWEFAAQWSGWIKANSAPAGPEAPSAEAFRDMVSRTVH